jgi:hypothetical protein
MGNREDTTSSGNDVVAAFGVLALRKGLGVGGQDRFQLRHLWDVIDGLGVLGRDMATNRPLNGLATYRE